MVDEMGVRPEWIQTVTFEDRRILHEFERDAVAFCNSYRPKPGRNTLFLMIDEFQYAQNGGQNLKLVYDTVKNLKIVITGSSSLDIRAQVGKYLVGRVLTFQLHPFSFGELLKSKDSRLSGICQGKQGEVSGWLFGDKKFSVKGGADPFADELLPWFEDYCIWGGYPSVVLAKNNEERQKVLDDINTNYLLKDIKGLLGLATDRNLLLLSQFLAAQTGNLMAYNSLGQSAGLNYCQLIRHLNILRETFICEEVRPFFTNRHKELSKNPKMFFNDLCFRNNLMDNMNPLDKRPDTGAIVENAVFISLKELGTNKIRLNFWRTKAGAEVDFVLHISGRTIPVEVKFSRFDYERLSRSFTSFADSFKPAKGLILTKDHWGRARRGATEILFMPAFYL